MSFFYSHDDSTRILHYFTCILLSITAQDTEPTVQDEGPKGNPANLTSFPVEDF